MLISLKGKQALVCGSSQGIGKAIAVQLAASGAEVIVMARTESKLKEVVEELPSLEGQQHRYIVADFANPTKVAEQVQYNLEKFKLSGVHILVNNAGGPAPGSIQYANVSDLRSAFEMHVVNNQMLSTLMLPYMREAGYGRIINVISTSVKEPIAGLGVSNTIRSAVAAWAKTLSSEVAKDGITVNNILPGYTNTARLSSLIEKRAIEGGKTIKEAEAEIVKDIPAGRFGEPQEPAALAAFLASPFAAYITGVSIQVDGGRTRCI